MRKKRNKVRYESDVKKTKSDDDDERRKRRKNGCGLKQ
jgi:hypothetical protein